MILSLSKGGTSVDVGLGSVHVRAAEEFGLLSVSQDIEVDEAQGSLLGWWLIVKVQKGSVAENRWIVKT